MEGGWHIDIGSLFGATTEKKHVLVDDNNSATPARKGRSFCVGATTPRSRGRHSFFAFFLLFFFFSHPPPPVTHTLPTHQMSETSLLKSLAGNARQVEDLLRLINSPNFVFDGLDHPEFSARLKHLIEYHHVLDSKLDQLVEKLKPELAYNVLWPKKGAVPEHDPFLPSRLLIARTEDYSSMKPVSQSPDEIR